MNELELKSLWKEYDQQQQDAKLLNLQSWVVNIQTKEAVQLMKAKSKLNRMGRFKSRMIFVGILWIMFLLYLVVLGFKNGNLIFGLSILVIAFFNILAVVFYISHKKLIDDIDNTDSVIVAQEKTAALQASTLKTVRILFLQAPFYSTWFYSAEQGFLVVAIPISLLIVAGSIWLYKNINHKNADKKWFRFLFSGPEWDPITKAGNYLKEIEEFKKDLATK